MLIDTHSHLFVEEFTEDLPLVMERAQKAGVSYIFMPNIDSTTIDAMLSVCRDYPVSYTHLTLPTNSLV